MLFCSGLL